MPADPRAEAPRSVRRYDLADRAQRAAFEAARRLVFPSPERFGPGEEVPPRGRYTEYVDYGAGHEAWIWDTTDPVQAAHAAAFRAVVAEEEAAARRERRRALEEARAGCVPDLDGRGLTRAEFELCPEKLEYYGDPPRLGNPHQSLDLLRLLLVNWGVREAVELAPKAVWQRALDELVELEDTPDAR